MDLKEHRHHSYAVNLMKQGTPGSFCLCLKKYFLDSDFIYIYRNDMNILKQSEDLQKKDPQLQVSESVDNNKTLFFLRLTSFSLTISMVTNTQM